MVIADPTQRPSASYVAAELRRLLSESSDTVLKTKIVQLDVGKRYDDSDTTMAPIEGTFGARRV